MYDDYTSHLCDSVTLRGSPPYDSNPFDFEDSRGAWIRPNPFNRFAFVSGTFADEQQEKQHPSEAYWKNERPVMETATIGTRTIQLPVIAPITEDILVKQTILERSFAHIEQINAKATEKVDILTQRFQDVVPNANFLVATALQELEDYEHAVFEFVNLELVDDMNQPIDVGDGPGIPIEARASAVYFKIALQILPRNCTQYNNIHVDPAQFPARYAKTT